MEIPPGLAPRFSPYSPGHLGVPLGTHCLITFTDANFPELHMTKEHLEDFVVHKLQEAFFILLHLCLLMPLQQGPDPPMQPQSYCQTLPTVLTQDPVDPVHFSGSTTRSMKPTPPLTPLPELSVAGILLRKQGAIDTRVGMLRGALSRHEPSLQ
ncbi:Zinc finger protein 576 [Microtus ochrogaster]|uniref:Zinc finger protein 576 n=1 Tax=Microtus ochrogaster TaxID=79684 RepID=A0A8J6GAM8_MICOH|nr:Zinc finger protein 576 [Microtus ochrogaster]